MLLISVKQQQQFNNSNNNNSNLLHFTSNETLTTFLKEFNFYIDSMNRQIA